LAPLLRTVAAATAGKTGAKWDFSARVAADVVLPRRLLGVVPARAEREARGKGVADMGRQFAGKRIFGWLRRNNLRAMAGWVVDSITNANDSHKQTHLVL
jgi:hypothetical protein